MLSLEESPEPAPTLQRAKEVVSVQCIITLKRSPERTLLARCAQCSICHTMPYAYHCGREENFHQTPAEVVRLRREWNTAVVVFAECYERERESIFGFYALRALYNTHTARALFARNRNSIAESEMLAAPAAAAARYAAYAIDSIWASEFLKGMVNSSSETFVTKHSARKVYYILCWIRARALVFFSVNLVSLLFLAPIQFFKFVLRTVSDLHSRSHRSEITN